MSKLLEPGEYQALNKRGINLETCRKFGYSISRLKDGTAVQIAPYYNAAGHLVAQHTRGPEKSFLWFGQMKEALLFGQPLWRTGGKRLIITEGEIDCMTISQLQNNKWPVVSIKSGANNATNDIKSQLEWVSSFETVVFCFDMDEPGRKAAEECALLLPPGKAHIAWLPYKDANECMANGKTAELIDALWNAKPYRPDGIKDGKELLAACLTPPTPGLEVPYPALNDMLLGIRPKEIYMLTAGSGIGKSTLANELGYHLHQVHGQALGVIALEDGVAKTGRRYVGMHLNTPLNLPGHEVAEEVFTKAFYETIGRGDWFIYEHFGSTDIDGLLGKIRYMAVSLGVKVLILDHISIVVSGLDEIAESERKTIDKFMTRLRALVEETGLTILAVVHLKRPDKGKSWNEGRTVSLTDLRGSGALEQLSDVVIALERNQQSDQQADVSTIRILKNRPVGKLGLAGKVIYSHDTGRLLHHEDDNPFHDEPYNPDEKGDDF